MNPYSDHAAGLAELQAEQGDACPTIFFAGVEIKVLAAAARIGGNNSVGGISLDSDLSVTALLADFPSTPKSNQLFKYPGETGKSYRIDNVFFAPGALQIRIAATAAAQGA